jgi:CCR4-NOT transcription complex subunit 3
MEAEMEELSANVKKKQKPPPRLTELEEQVNRIKDQTDKLEKLLRCIDNETISPDELEDLKADVDMYLNPEEGEECEVDFSCVDDMYGMFSDRLEAVDNAAPAQVPAHVKHGKGAGRGGPCMSTHACGLYV